MPTPTMSRVTRPGAVQKNMKSPAGAASAAAAAAKKKVPPNKSILTFFKKVPPPEESMFVAGSAGAVFSQPADQDEEKENSELEIAEANEAMVVDGTVETRFNEIAVSIKRRRMSEEKVIVSAGYDAVDGTSLLLPRPTKQVQRGPFVDDSDSDDDGGDDNSAQGPTDHDETREKIPSGKSGDPVSTSEETFDAPHLLESHTSFDETFQKSDPELTNDNDNDFGEFDGADFGEDEDFEGEEFRERKYMEEQARLEAEAISSFGRSDSCDDGGIAAAEDDAMASCCPICGASLAGSTPDQATVHVNACLDGGAADGLPDTNTTAPEAKRDTKPTAEKPREDGASSAEHKQSLSGLSKRFMRTAQARPGQANPISVGGGGGGVVSSSGPQGAAGSAFAKLMSGHAEDAAWSTAAASEFSSRGKPAYERTCPFYKIMPGFFICVDAFRYGAVEGCRAYFLSHFHSDHYVGLTAKWCHGPIYCSAVTASLVRSQLGTAAKWVVELDFEATVDVPGTEGVRVTMIPANHCPGSSMFLFEKTLASRRTQRILHCGDFRACRPHVRHPLLAPDTLDALSGKSRQQRIDVCYLDTTYLNPRYSFPPQDDVVTACADLCASLDRSLKAGQDGEWEKALRRREGGGGDSSGNVKDFFMKETSGSISNNSNNNNNNTKETAQSAKLAPSPPPNALSALGRPPPPSPNRNRLLVICGTYSIGKERICKAIAQALGTKIFASPAKIKIVAQLGDPELTALMTPNATEAQVHMQMLMELRPETLAEYLDGYRAHFSRIVGFRPSGWNYRPTMANGGGGASGSSGANKGGAAAVAAPANLSPSTVPTASLLHGPGWRTRFGVRDLVPQRGSTREAICFGVPYSEHSSFRELALFLMALRIDKVVPTVNVGSDATRKRMKAWIDRWLSERRRGGIVRVLSDEEEAKEGTHDVKLWEGKDGLGGGAYW